MTEDRAARICLGVVTGAQGVRGAVRVKSFTAVPEDVAAYGEVEDESGTRRFALEIVGRAKGVVVAKVAGIADRDAAERLKGVRLFIGRDRLPAPAEDEFYHADLIGLRADLVDGTELGRIRAVHDYGAGDSLEVMRSAGGVVMVPFTKRVVPVVDLAAGRVVIDPPEGLLDGRTVESELQEASGGVAAAEEERG